MGKRRILTGAELRYAAENGVPVFYEETYCNPQDEHMNFKGECVLKEAGGTNFYIGNSDIDVEEFELEDDVQGEFGEGFFAVRAAKGQKYK